MQPGPLALSENYFTKAVQRSESIFPSDLVAFRVNTARVADPHLRAYQCPGNTEHRDEHKGHQIHEHFPLFPDLSNLFVEFPANNVGSHTNSFFCALVPAFDLILHLVHSSILIYQFISRAFCHHSVFEESHDMTQLRQCNTPRLRRPG
jgi:hypothetical protein